MAQELTPVDITDTTDLLRIAEEVRRSGQPRLLRQNSEDLAVLMPAAKPKRRSHTPAPQTKGDPLRHVAGSGIQRALSAIGTWEHLDAEGGPDMLDELDRMRHETKPTPPFEL